MADAVITFSSGRPLITRLAGGAPPRPAGECRACGAKAHGATGYCVRHGEQVRGIESRQRRRARRSETSGHVDHGDEQR